MGIYYYAVDTNEKKYFSAPGRYAIKAPGMYHPENPFPGMMLMKNHQGYDFEIWDDCGNDIPPSRDYEDITDEVYEEYKKCFREYYQWKG